MDVLDKMVSLILQDPFLTATEIARRLGYAEEKTVYYWVDKAHYPGLVAFKRAVLSGQYRSSSAQESPARYGLIPIIRGFSTEGVPIVTGQHYRGVAPDGDVQYAWRFEGQTDWVILPGDWLLLASLDHTRTNLRGWCVAFNSKGDPVIRMLIATDGEDHPRLIIPQAYRPDPSSVPRFMIRHLFRNLDC